MLETRFEVADKQLIVRSVWQAYGVFSCTVYRYCILKTALRDRNLDDEEGGYKEAIGV